jgi:ankyrin repeat protein
MATDFTEADFPKLLEMLKLRPPPDIDGYRMYIEGKNFCIEFTTNVKTWKSNDDHIETMRNTTDKAALAKKIDMLLDKPHLVNRPDKGGDTPLHAALLSGDPKLLKTILENPNLNPNLPNAKGVTALMMALEKGVLDDEGLKKLLLKGDLKSKDAEGNNLLHYACKFSNLAAVETLLGRGIGIEEQNNKKETALFNVFRNTNQANRTGILKVMCDKGANVNHVSALNKSPLLTAMEVPGTDAADCVRVLLSKGVDVNRELNNITPLQFAASKGLSAVANVLDADLNKQDKNGYSALMIAAAYGNHEVANILVDKGAKRDLLSGLGDNAFLLAIKGGVKKETPLEAYKDTVAALIKKNALPSDETLEETGPYDISSLMKLTDSTDPNFLFIQYKLGRSGFLYACQRGHLEIVKALYAKDNRVANDTAKTNESYMNMEALFSKARDSIRNLFKHQEAVFRGHKPSLYRTYLEANFEYNEAMVKHHMDMTNMSGLLIAAAYGKEKIITHLLETLPIRNLLQKDSYSNSILHHILYSNKFDPIIQRGLLQTIHARRDIDYKAIHQNGMGYEPIHIGITMNNNNTAIYDDLAKLGTLETPVQPTKFLNPLLLATMLLKAPVIKALCKLKPYTYPSHYVIPILKRALQPGTLNSIKAQTAKVLQIPMREFMAKFQPLLEQTSSALDGCERMEYNPEQSFPDFTLEPETPEDNEDEDEEEDEAPPPDENKAIEQGAKKAYAEFIAHVYEGVRLAVTESTKNARSSGLSDAALEAAVAMLNKQGSEESDEEIRTVKNPFANPFAKPSAKPSAKQSPAKPSATLSPATPSPAKLSATPSPAKPSPAKQSSPESKELENAAIAAAVEELNRRFPIRSGSTVSSSSVPSISSSSVPTVSSSSATIAPSNPALASTVPSSSATVAPPDPALTLASTVPSSSATVASPSPAARTSLPSKSIRLPPVPPPTVPSPPEDDGLVQAAIQAAVQELNNPTRRGGKRKKQRITRRKH